jgi:hypothetical protein
MTWAPVAVQAVLFAVLLWRGWWRQLPIFTIAVALGTIKNALYDPAHVNIPLQIIEAVARVAFAVEAVWLLTRHMNTWNRAAGIAGIGIFAAAGPAALYNRTMQFNVAPVWRALGCAFAFAALGLLLALLADWLWGSAPQWIWVHSLIATLYFAEQTLMQFPALGRGQATEWHALFHLHAWFRLAVWSTWLVVFTWQRLKQPNGRRHYEND